MLHKKRNIFQELLWKNKWLLVMEILFGYAVTKILIIGNESLSNAIDCMLEETETNLFDLNFIIWLGLLVLSGFFCSFFRQKCAASFSIRIQTEFRKRAARKLLHMNYEYFDTNNSSSVMNKLISDINIVSMYYSETLPAIITVLVTAVTVLVSMWKIDHALILFFIIVFPIILSISHYANQKIGALQKRHWELQDEVNEIAYDNIQGIIVGKSYNLFPIMKNKIYSANEKLLRFEFLRNRISAISWILTYVVKWMPHLLLGIMILYRVAAGELSVGTMTYFILMLDRIIHPLSELMSYLMTAKTAYISKQRLDALMEQPEEKHGEVLQTADKSACSVLFQDVVFGYNQNRNILNGIDFQIKKGEQIAFVGESGEGKSTILKLLCSFYKPQHGEIYLYGTSLKKWNLEAARNLMSVVSQNIFLFPETIAWNIACGKETCTQHDIEEACKKANIHDFILSLPNGYETMVGERGDLLSGGQKQRISIARAFLKDAPILLLDEPTSAIDMKTEKLIKEAIDRIRKDRTVITIAHRLSTIEGASRIYVLSGGNIAEIGTNKELLAKKGIYYSLYEAQRKGMTE